MRSFGACRLRKPPRAIGCTVLSSGWRWLLMTQDRVDSGSLRITHDFLATMLGTDRPSVSLAAGVLQKEKIIEYTRGAVKIVNRKKLEHSACECYRVIRQYDGELGLQ